MDVCILGDMSRVFTINLTEIANLICALRDFI